MTQLQKKQFLTILWFLMPRREGFVVRSVPMLAFCILFVWIGAPIGPSTGALSAIIAWLVYECAIYQSRYLVNDALGYGEDRKIYGSIGVGRVPPGLSKKQVWTAAITRSTLALILLALIAPSRPMIEILAIVAMLVSAIVYEFMRYRYRGAKSVPIASRRLLLILVLAGITGNAARALWSISIAAALLSRTLNVDVYLSTAIFMSAIGILGYVYNWASSVAMYTTKSKGGGYRVPLSLADRPHAVAALGLFLPGPIDIKGDSIPDQPLEVFKHNDVPFLMRAGYILAAAFAATCGAAIGQQVPLILALVIGFVIGIIASFRPLDGRDVVAVSILTVLMLTMSYGWQSGVTTVGVALVPYIVLLRLMTINERITMKRMYYGTE